MDQPERPVAAEKLAALTQHLAQVIRGKDECIEMLVVAMLANGSVLMEDVPGVGKTTLAKALAKSIDLNFNRVQFTPDLLPSDILGASVYNPVDGSFTFREGPIFCNILLADEINRASPRTQSALLESMSEGQVTIEGERRELEQPFFVLATQNPIDFHGTYPLPEAQLDRFLLQLHPGYPDPETEIDILHAQAKAHPVDSLQPFLSAAELIDFQTRVCDVTVERLVSGYIVGLVNKSRDDARLKIGVSPRGSLMLFRASQAAAFFAGRDYVTPDDVQRMAPYVLSHRVILTSRARYGKISKRMVIDDILTDVSVPV
ncbi:MAG: AAA family ATPase [Planctomycetaceae bacterium]